MALMHHIQRPFDSSLKAYMTAPVCAFDILVTLFRLMWSLFIDEVALTATISVCVMFVKRGQTVT